MLFETVFNNLISTVNTTVLSGCSETGVAATGSVGTVINMLILAFTALSVGASIAISNYLGAKEWKTARELVFVGVVLCIGIGALLSIVCFFAVGGIVSLLHLEGEVYVLAVAYFKIRVAGSSALRRSPRRSIITTFSAMPISSATASAAPTPSSPAGFAARGNLTTLKG